MVLSLFSKCLSTSTKTCFWHCAKRFAQQMDPTGKADTLLAMLFFWLQKCQHKQPHAFRAFKAVDTHSNTTTQISHSYRFATWDVLWMESNAVSVCDSVKPFHLWLQWKEGPWIENAYFSRSCYGNAYRGISASTKNPSTRPKECSRAWFYIIPTL